MIPFARMIKYGGTPYRNNNEIISKIQNQMKAFVTYSSTDSSRLNLSPSNFFTRRTNAIQFAVAGYIQLSTSGIPSVYQIGNSTNFVIESNVYLTSTNTQILVGNLNNTSGTGSYWITLNNTFQTASMISLDGFTLGGGGAVQRFRFGVGSTKLPVNTWFNIKLQRIGTSLTFWMNGTQVGSAQTMTNGFAASANSMKIASTSDQLLPLIGYIDNFSMTMGT